MSSRVAGEGREKEIMRGGCKDGKTWRRLYGFKRILPGNASISIYPCPLVSLGSSLCEFDSKDQVSVAIYVTMAVSFEKEGYVMFCVGGS